jgi:hypothetical protein
VSKETYYSSCGLALTQLDVVGVKIVHTFTLRGECMKVERLTTWMVMPAVLSFLSVIPQNKTYSHAHDQQHMNYSQFLKFFTLLYNQYLAQVLWLCGCVYVYVLVYVCVYVCVFVCAGI